MGRTPEKDYGIGYEPLKARITKTADGYPVELAVARDAYGPATMRSAEDGWFWIFATPAAAGDIRRRGLKGVGTVVTTWIPPQSAVTPDPEAARLEAVAPVVGSQAHTEAMLEETRQRRAS